ncbi:MAG: MCE family protein [Myxococcales bacterium]|nr:MCE family protein [Myxococcales bacterium]
MHRLALVVLLVAVACDSTVTREASLDDAAGLAEGASVVVSGVVVGRVKDVTLQGGGAPVRVRFEVDEGAVLPDPLCAVIGPGPSLALSAERARAGVFPDVPPCASVLESLRDALPSSLGEAAERAGAAVREASEGFLRGAAGDDSARDVGRAIGETLRELERGAVEGAQTPTGP